MRLVLAVLISVFWNLELVHSQESQSANYESVGQKFKVEILSQQKDVVWGFDFLPDGRIIFTERQGALRILDPKSKKITDVKGAPSVWAHGQGGLLDVRVHPKKSNQIYLTYSEPVGKKATTALMTGILKNNEITQGKKLFSAQAANENEIHFGSRIEFDQNGHIFITVGDRNERYQAQDLGYHMGKVIRLKEDGSVPADNPFVKQKNAKPEIWSLGHRNPQGMSRNSQTGELWVAEMGPRGGDELNLIKPGANYGWPIVTFGREYFGPKIGEGTSKKGMEDPIAHWVPSISPSGIAVYTGKAFPKWQGNIFMGNLSGMHLRRIQVEGQQVKQQEELLKDLGVRIRNVRSGPDGFLYFSTDDGRIARLVPAST